jgi:hypothetical protein
MNNIGALAHPWWVNLLIAIPFVLFWIFRKNKAEITKRQLLVVGAFGIAFGFVEAAVVIYLRAAVGFLPGYMGTLSEVMRQATDTYQQVQAMTALPQSLMTVEIIREIATMLMLASVALLSAKKLGDQFAIFLWAFAFWDVSYYVGLWLTVRWPSSLTTDDVLFLIPVPWLAQVWFPLFICGLTMFAIVWNRKNPVQDHEAAQQMPPGSER